MSNTPTDDQAWQVLLEIPEQENEQAVVGAFARAVLAKWGTPQPIVREPLTDEQLRLKQFASSSLFHLFERWDSKENPHHHLLNEMGLIIEHVIQRTVAAHGITQKGGSNADT